jgi:hypothetical protein
MTRGIGVRGVDRCRSTDFGSPFRAKQDQLQDRD